MSPRPAVSVVVPFAGGAEEAREMVGALATLRRGPDDELVVADNTGASVVTGELARHGEVALTDVVDAGGMRSSYYARNVGAERASNEWLLFVDSDCRPTPTLLDDLLGEAPGEDVGLIAGGVVSGAEQPTVSARYARSRGHIADTNWVDPPTAPHVAAVTANLLVRRVAWESLGGFHEVRSGADVEFCLRAQDAGWTLIHRPLARVEHVHPRALAPMLRKTARRGSGQAWVNRRYRGAYPRYKLLRSLARSATGGLVWAVTLRFERSLFKLIDGLWTWAHVYGYYCGDNRPCALAGPEPVEPVAADNSKRVVVLADAFPIRSETFVYNEVAALQRLGWMVRVESSARPGRTERSVALRTPVEYLEDGFALEKLRALVWLVARHPLRCLRDAWSRRRWKREEAAWRLGSLAPVAKRLAAGGERHLHAHFASGAALHALRLSRLLGISYSVSTHAYELFQEPRNLSEKLTGSVFSIAECEYTASRLRELMPNKRADSVYVIATGVDPDRFRRSRPPPGDGTVIAIGRLVEKKGFPHLIDAVARVAGDTCFKRLVIAGEGPLRDELDRQIEERQVAEEVELRGNVWGGDAVRDLLEQADLLCVPSLVAGDGDRDALPVVIYEALAMEVPVVATAVAGIPEAIRPEWGRLVRPGDPEDLAGAIAELLLLPAPARAAMGRAGREFVTAERDSRKESARLSELLHNYT